MNSLFALLPFVSASLALASSSAPYLNYQAGPIQLLHGGATVQADQTLRYLDAADAKKVIVDVWGNPPQVAQDVLGMLVPGSAAPDTEGGWGIVLTESQDGHVSDSDAAKTDYAELLHTMQSGTEERNAARKKAGYEPIKLVGWAEPPSYDAATHKMYWARELAFGEAATPQADHTLNYAVRVLGRQDVLELNAVGSMAQLPAIRQGMQQVVQRVSFNPGARYEDFNGGTDKLAAYGIAGLIAGGAVAQKVGLFALLPLLLKKGWIVIIALLALLRRLGGVFRRRSALRADSAVQATATPVARPSGASALAGLDAFPQKSRLSLSKPGDRPLGRHEGE
ncbi:DUF2167 domain-containing protein [Deinococcus sp.]|uniref:DUF2167 domain-containing protein n=1 Tax=Deinococcus sp. TaxID=47478 RepID=UPI003CC56BC3